MGENNNDTGLFEGLLMIVGGISGAIWGYEAVGWLGLIIGALIVGGIGKWVGAMADQAGFADCAPSAQRRNSAIHLAVYSIPFSMKPSSTMIRTIIVLITCTYFDIAVIPVQAQSGIADKIITVPKDSEKTVYRLAGDYSEEHDVLTIAMLRGTDYREDYDDFIPFFSKKLDSLEIPHMFFQYFVDDKPGTIFDYFIENNAHGSCQYDVLLALLPHIQRRYKAAYRSN